MVDAPEDGSRRVKTAGTVFGIIELLRDRNGATVTEVATETGLAKSTASAHLNSLMELEYTVRDGNVYRLSTQFLSLGHHVRYSSPARVMSKDIVSELAEETNERAQFVVEEFGKGAYIHCFSGSRGVRTDSAIGKRIHLHATAAGKAILAFTPEERVDEILDKWGLPEVTPRTITTREGLFEELESVRERGFGINDEETIEGLRSIAVPVKDSQGTVLGALGISGPTHRMKGDWFYEEIPDLLLAMVNELELNLKYSTEESGPR